LQTQDNGGPVRNVTYSFQVGGSVPFFTENFDGAVVPALPAGWTTSTLSGTANPWVTNASSTASAPNQAFVTNLATTSDSVLISPVIAVPAGPAAVSFRSSYDVEPFFDGGVLEISVGGGAYQDILTAGGSFVSGGYTGTIGGLSNRQAWTGNSGSYITTAANLPGSASGQNINLRWRMASDSAIAATGWSFDNLSVYGFQCDAFVKRRRAQTTTN
jgi:hypothetical protein